MKTRADADAAETTTVAGVVERLKCSKTTFCAGFLTSGGRRVSFSVKGYVVEGDPVTIRGRWETHPQWGRQFRGTEVVYTVPADADGIAAWLARNVQGMGPVKAQALADLFGAELPRLLRQDPERVAIEGRLPLDFVRRTAEAWHAAADKANACAALAGHGLTQHEVEKVYGRYKGSAVAVLEADPYLLVGDLPGFGWARVDAIGQKLGVKPDHPGRVRAALAAVVMRELDEGSTCCSREGAINAAADLVGAAVPRGLLESALADAVAKGLLVELGDAGLAGAKQHATEAYLWERFETGADENPCFRDWSSDDLDAAVAAAARVGDYDLDESQVEALRAVARSRIAVVTGGAGSGKTLVARAVVKLVELGDKPVASGTVDARTHSWGDGGEPTGWGEDRGPDAPPPGDTDRPAVALCAPTGKAARRLSEVIGRDASTIHRLLHYDPQTGGFLYNRHCHLPYDCVVVDEASMIDAALAADLLEAVGPDTAVVLIGDDNQLPPVGPGYPLRDVLDHRLVPGHKLAKCHRQAGSLKANAVRVLDGVVEPSVLDEGDPGPWLVHRGLEGPDKVLATARRLAEDLLPRWGYAGLMDAQFVTARHDGVMGTRALNEMLQRVYQARLGVALAERPADEALPLLVGDKVIHTKNNYALGVMNGTIGVVAADDELVVEYDGRRVAYPKDCRGEVSLAYCLTCHKMQGSEVPCVVVVCPRAHAFMQHRSWLYTAVTRARKTCVVIGDQDGIRRAADRVETSRRRTVLEFYARNPGVRP